MSYMHLLLSMLLLAPMMFAVGPIVSGVHVRALVHAVAGTHAVASVSAVVGLAIAGVLR
jgi:hypothetical protein